jgi:hypothetical protein
MKPSFLLLSKPWLRGKKMIYNYFFGKKTTEECRFWLIYLCSPATNIYQQQYESNWEICFPDSWSCLFPVPSPKCVTPACSTTSLFAKVNPKCQNKWAATVGAAYRWDKGVFSPWYLNIVLFEALANWIALHEPCPVPNMMFSCLKQFGH